MNTMESDDGHVFVRLGSGDLLLESIREACEEHGVQTGMMVSGIATLRNLNYHYVPTDEFPKDRSERNEFLELDGAWEVGTIDGVIADGEPHLHMVAYNGEETIAGHVEEGNEVHVTCELVIRRVDDIDLTRRRDEMNVSALQHR